MAAGSRCLRAVAISGGRRAAAADTVGFGAFAGVDVAGSVAGVRRARALRRVDQTRCGGVAGCAAASAPEICAGRAAVIQRGGISGAVGGVA